MAPLNVASSAALLSSIVSLLAAGGAWLTGRARSCRYHRRFAWVAATAALVSAANFPATLDPPSPLQLPACRAQAFFLALHLCAWIAYVAAWGHKPLRHFDRLAFAAAGAMGALALVPRAVFGDGLMPCPVRWLGVTYQDPVFTPLGHVIAALLLAIGVATLLRGSGFARKGAPWPRVHLACGALILALEVHDMLFTELPLGTPSLLDVGFLVAVLAMAFAGTSQLIDDENKLSEAMPLIVWMARPDGTIDYVNRRAVVAGALDSEERGWLWGAAIHPDDMEATLAAWTRSVRAGEPYEAEHRIRLAGGTFRWHLSRAEPLRDHGGGILQWCGTTTDIHDQKQAQELLRENDRRKDRFLGVIAHELRNPLAPIRLSTDLLGHAPPGSAQARRARAIIVRQTEHLTRLVDDLLEVTRVANGKIVLRREPVDLAELLTRAAEDHQGILEGRGRTFRLELPAAKVWADADATRVAQIVGNLLRNAAKFTREGDEVTLSLAVVADEAEIRVRDTGAGIDPELLPRLFEPFVQGQRTLGRSEGGLGLGLALVKRLAELHGGSVKAESPGMGRGATFVVRLSGLS